jgi:hypothetical protein
MKHPKVIVTKLGKQGAWGLYDGKIYIDPRLKGKARLECLVHEYLHHLCPEMTEEAVTDKGRRLADFLHKNHVRIIEPENKSLKELE